MFSCNWLQKPEERYAVFSNDDCIALIKYENTAPSLIVSLSIIPFYDGVGKIEIVRVEVVKEK